MQVNQAMADGKLDAFVRPAGIGAASMDQLGAKRKFRLLDVDPAKMVKFMAKPDRIMMKIPAGTYKNQSNNERRRCGRFPASISSQKKYERGPGL